MPGNRAWLLTPDVKQSAAISDRNATQPPSPTEARADVPHLKLESMSRIAIICCLAALLGSCGTQTVQRIDWDQARLACADVGIEPGSGVFNRCVFDLYYSLWAGQYAAER
jgi:hypothetical protein